MTILEMLHSEQYPMFTTSALVSAAGALREALLIGYDLPRMEGLWPSEKQCPGFKYAHSVRVEHAYMHNSLHALQLAKHCLQCSQRCNMVLLCC